MEKHFLLLVLILSNKDIRADDVCAFRKIKEISKTRNTQGEETLIPGIWGFGMKPMLEITKSTSDELPIAILGDSRTDPLRPEFNDIQPDLQPMRQGASVTGWGMLRWTIGISSTQGPTLPKYTRDDTAKNVYYAGVNDFLEATTQPDRKRFQRDYSQTFFNLLRNYTNMESVSMTGSKVSGKGYCTAAQLTWRCNNAECLTAIFAGQSGCTYKGKPYKSFEGEVITWNNVLQIESSDCFVACNVFKFSVKDTTPLDVYKIYSSYCAEGVSGGCAGGNGHLYYSWMVEMVSPSVIPYGSYSYPTDGVDSLHGSTKMREWFGYLNKPGHIWNTTCITNAGGTNTTTGIVQIGIPAETHQLGVCPNFISSRREIPKVPTEYATRHSAPTEVFLPIGRMKDEKIPGWALVLLGGLFGGPVGAVMGYLAASGHSSIKQIDDEIERRVQPALDQVNRNFEIQAGINRNLSNSIDSLATSVRNLAENQMVLMMEVQAMNIILGMADFTDQASQELKDQLRGYAQKHDLPWDEATGCVRLDYECDQKCLDTIVNETRYINTIVKPIENMNFTEAVLGPRAQEQLNFSSGASIALIIFSIIILIVIIIIIYFMCGGRCGCCTGCGNKL